jgi:N-acetylglutamate synthase/N-acetylornithine aminotransferase
MSPLFKHAPNIFGQNQNTSLIMMPAGAHSFDVNSSRVLQSVQDIVVPHWGKGARRHAQCNLYHDLDLDCSASAGMWMDRRRVEFLFS